MNLHELVRQWIVDTCGLVTAGGLAWPTPDSSLGAFLPELCLCTTIVLMLLIRVFPWGRRVDVFYFALAGTALALACLAPWEHLGGGALGPSHPLKRAETFSGMLVYDAFSVFMRTLLIGFAFLFALFTKLSGVPDREDGPDIYTLVLGAILGMCLMVSANHLLMVFLAIEMASVPSYVLAGLLKGRRSGSEAALKYSIYGAGTAGVMLYGISLMAGLFNTAHLPTLAQRMSEQLPGMKSGETLVLVVAGLMIMVGLAFKLSAVPFHFWCPDVFQGATAEVNALLSVASKAAALGLLVRLAIGFGAVPANVENLALAGEVHVAEREARGGEQGAGSEQQEGGNGKQPAEWSEPGERPFVAASGAPGTAMSRLASSRNFMGQLVAFLAILTCTFGNLAAYAQTNMKRLLAYSTIAHAGYMMMPVSALLVMAGHNPAVAETAVSGLAMYMIVYLFMNLGAFAVVAFLRNVLLSEQITDYTGLVRRCPGLAICFSIMLFSLVGLPPLSGFIGKFAIFASLVDGYQISATAGHAQSYLLVLLVAGGLNTVLSLFYYLRVVKIMTIGEPAPPDPIPFSAMPWQAAFVGLLTLPTALLIVNWDVVNQWTLAAARHLLT